jgi:glycosyltransferase involved in cell wall biosynthesis
MATKKPRVLFITPILRHPPVGGPYLRIENSIKALHRISDLYIYSKVSPPCLGSESAFSFYKQYCLELFFSPSTAWQFGIRGFLQKAINYFPRRIIGCSLLTLEDTDYKDVLKTAKAIQADVIWLGYGNISYQLLRYIKRYSPYKVVLDTDSVWSRFILRGLPYATDERESRRIEKMGKAKEEEERRGTQIADVTTAVSEVDAEYYRALAKHPLQVRIFSNVIDTEAYQKIPPVLKGFKKPCIYLAGSFGPRSPMEDAARWVIREVLPLIRRKRPDLHFYIVGSGSDRTLVDNKDPDITITGRISSVLPYLCHADVAVVPLRFESGTRFKILEASACAIPVVSTTLGAEGIKVSPGRDILIADTPEAFASSVLKLVDNRVLARELGDNLRQLVRENYSIYSLVQEGKSILNYLSSLV